MSEAILDRFTNKVSDQDSPEDDTSEARPEVAGGESDRSTNDSVPIAGNADALIDQQDDLGEPKVTKKRLIRLSDSDSELEGNDFNSDHDSKTKSPVKLSVQSSDGSSDEQTPHSVPKKSRIKKFDSSESETDNQLSRSTEARKHSEEVSEKNISDNSLSQHKSTSKKPMSKYADSDSSETETQVPSKYEEQKIRIKDKRNKLRQKFKNLVTSREKESETNGENVQEKNSSSEGEKEASDNSDDDLATSIDQIKQKIKEQTIHLKSTIYDPDTSTDDETAAPKLVPKQKKPRKSTKPTSPKPMRISAKQAMENMQKIKSESNRMLREKEVSLPYHRPKALTLKDIMSRRRPALTSDGKALPIKMNEEQLKQYALSLEVRQKEMMELCKSDTEDENEETIENNDNNELESKDKSETQIETTTDIPSQNDTLFDTVTQENSESILKTVNNGDEVSNSTLGVINDEINNHITLDFDMNGETSLKNLEEATEIVNRIDNEDNLIINEDINSLDTNSTVTNNRENTEVNIKDGKETEMHLVYNDSIEEKDVTVNKANNIEDNIDKHENSETNPKIGIEVDSQLISLHYDTERTENYTENDTKNDRDNVQKDVTNSENVNCEEQKEKFDDGFSDDEIDMADIDDMIENAEIIGQNNADNYDSPMLIRDPRSKSKPKLTGAPGMIIDLDGTNPTQRKLSGVELLKERFTYFAKLKTPEEMEREREKKLKPGMQHLKLRQELEHEIAEQRSLEWAKRLQEEKQLHQELNPEDKGSEAEDDIDKIEAKLEETDLDESSGESEPEENDCDITDKPAQHNPMIADEAEESDCDDDAKANDENNDDVGDNDQDSNDDGDDEESDDESSEEESEEEPTKLKKGRILKAFEDSDDETEKSENMNKESGINVESPSKNVENIFVKENDLINPGLKETQDDDLQLAQELRTQSEDIFASQESSLGDKETPGAKSGTDDKDLGTQTFSIIDSVAKNFRMPDDVAVVCDTEFSQEGNLDAVVAMCSGSFPQGIPVTESQESSQLPISQSFGDDVLALCTGKFYDNPFVSQMENSELNKETSEPNNEKNRLDDADVLHLKNDDKMQIDDDLGKESIQNINDVMKTQTENKFEYIEQLTNLTDTRPISDSLENSFNNMLTKENPKDDILESILDELNEPEAKKPNEYFTGNIQNKENKQDEANTQHKKRFIIDSDDDNENDEESIKKTKKTKKKKLEKRALQISDDESEQSDEDEEYTSEVEEEDDQERIVEYDSEENEVEVAIHNPVKKLKKQKAPDFFEQEAELTSEDEWMGSGDEDEAGLDRMEREAGDDDTFNQTRLQRELGQIHMRDVLDQDKREVRIIQELLFEDGDLGAGSRQRKFRWKNNDAVDETGTVLDDLQDTQEEEFESEEQWRKQRHERETFLREMQKQGGTEEILDISVDRTSMIKANLNSKRMSTLEEVNTSVTTTEVTVVEKKTSKDVPSPKKSAFTLFKQSYHGSLLTRGQGALARLAALATPLAADEDASKVGSLAPNSKRNFVFATLTQEDSEPKVAKRKAETNIGTPKLVKKLRTEDKPKQSKSSLLDHYDSLA